MKKFFKKGFTLAEALITMGIVGVIAALTIPQLNANVSNQQIGPALAKFVSDFEGAAQLAMKNEGMATMNGDTEHMTALAKYLYITPMNTTYKNSGISWSNSNGIKNSSVDVAEYVVTSPNGSNTETIATLNMKTVKLADGTTTQWYEDQSGTTASSNTLWKMKNGNAMVVVPCTTYGSEMGAYGKIVAEIFVDIDGNKSTNIAGKDVFMFLLTQSGSLIPYASSEYKYWYSNSATKYATSVAKYNTDVTSANCALSSMNYALACTGAIADNKYSTKSVSAYE